MCWEASVWLGGWWRWSLGRPWRPSRSPIMRSSLETDASAAFSGSSGFRVYRAQPRQTAAMLQPLLLPDSSPPRQIPSRLGVSRGLTARLCRHLRTLSHLLMTCWSSQTRLPRSRAAAHGREAPTSSAGVRASLHRLNSLLSNQRKHLRALFLGVISGGGL